MIEMPARELARGDAARDRVEQRRAARSAPGCASLEDGVVQDLVQQHREVEDCESLDERERNPDQGVSKRMGAQVAGARIANWRDRHQEVPRRRFRVKLAHQLTAIASPARPADATACWE